MLVALVFLLEVLIFNQQTWTWQVARDPVVLAVLSNTQRGHWDLKHKPSVATVIPMLPLCHSPELALIAHEAIEHQADVRLKL